ncbi:MAG: hypothetical protein V5A88_09880 [Candidatus Thermoplasmatota archaeon]
MSEDDEDTGWSEYLFLAGMFTGLGLGFLFDEVVAGILLGLGVGFLLSGVAKRL